MSWHFSRALVGAYSERISSDLCRFVLSNEMSTVDVFSCDGSAMGICQRSRYGMTFAIDISMYRRKMDAWIKNTDTAKSVNAPSVANRSSHETREARNNAARMPAVVFSKQGRRFVHAPSAGKSFCHLAQDTKRAPANAERLFAYRAGSSIQWSKFGNDSPCSAVRLLQGAYEIRPIEQQRFSDIRSKSFGHTLRSISRLVCHGTTTGRESTNGA